jgi:hypothetical protein
VLETVSRGPKGPAAVVLAVVEGGGAAHERPEQRANGRKPPTHEFGRAHAQPRPHSAAPAPV